MDIVATPRLIKYNLKASLGSLSGGASTGAYVLKTANAAAVAGTNSQINNGRIISMSHGPGLNTPCFYFATTTRVYRSKNVETITDGDTEWLSAGDVMVEVPPGGAGNTMALANQSSVEYSNTIDRLFIMTSGYRSYVTEYNILSNQYNRIFLIDSRQYNGTTMDSNATVHPSHSGVSISMWVEDGMAYLVRTGTSSVINQMYSLPVSSDWQYADSTKGYIVTPRIITNNCSKYIRAYVNNVSVLGGKISSNLGMPTEPYILYYRTSGISEDSGGWTELGSFHDLSGVDGSTEIQFMFKFKILGATCIPARILSLSVLYEDLSTDSHYQPSVGLSNITNKRFAWRFSTAFGDTVPNLRIRIYDAVSGASLLDDNTSGPTGTFEQSTNGGSSWSAWTNSDKTNDDTYIRYTPSSFPEGVKARSLLTLL